MPQTPSQRITRSGSNASSRTLNDVKGLIESNQAETVKSLKKKITMHGEKLQKKKERKERKKDFIASHDPYL